jgi:hypothetical protein
MVLAGDEIYKMHLHLGILTNRHILYCEYRYNDYLVEEPEIVTIALTEGDCYLNTLLIHLYIPNSHIALYLQNLYHNANQDEEDYNEDDIHAEFVCLSVFLEDPLQLARTLLKSIPCLFRFIVDLFD